MLHHMHQVTLSGNQNNNDSIANSSSSFFQSVIQLIKHFPLFFCSSTPKRISTINKKMPAAAKAGIFIINQSKANIPFCVKWYKPWGKEKNRRRHTCLLGFRRCFSCKIWNKMRTGQQASSVQKGCMEGEKISFLCWRWMQARTRRAFEPGFSLERNANDAYYNVAVSGARLALASRPQPSAGCIKQDGRGRAKATQKNRQKLPE